MARAAAFRVVIAHARAREFYPDWERAADDAVGLLRAEPGRVPYGRGLSHLVRELSTWVETVRSGWAARNSHYIGVKQMRHPVVGELTLTYEIMQLAADTGVAMLAYRAEPATPSGDRLKLLGSWVATVENAGTAQAMRGSSA